MDHIFIIVIVLFGVYTIYSFVNTYLQLEKSRLEREIAYKKLKEQLDEALRAEILRASLNNQKYQSKWYKLNKSDRDKILKVRSLSLRGEGGEKTNAQEKYNNLLKKHNLTPSDVLE